MPVRVVRDPPISWIIIDREDKGNSLDYEHAIELARHIEIECSNDETLVVALRGAGERFFSTGVDLESVSNISGAEDAWRLMYEGLGGICKALASCNKPVIAAVNGHAIGIGFELLHASDIAIAVKGVKLGSPAVKWGMVPPATPTIGPWTIGYKRAAFITLTGLLITSEEAVNYGIVNFVVDSVDELEEKVKEIATAIAANDQWAVRTAKELLKEARPHLILQRGLMSLVYSASRQETVKRAREFFDKSK